MVDMAKAVRFPNDLAGSAMARDDLLHLGEQLNTRYGEEPCRSLYSFYGLEAEAREQLLEVLKRYRSRRRVQAKVKRARFQLRSRLSWIPYNLRTRSEAKL
jgi:hypothetical protein